MFACVRTYKKHIHRVQPTRCNVSQFIYFCKTLYIFQAVFPSIIRSSKLRIKLQVFVGPILLPAASLTRLAAGSIIGLKHVERLTEINKLLNVVSCWLHSVNILAMRGPMNVKLNVKKSIRNTFIGF